MTKITVTCDCGCGQTIQKTPCKIKQWSKHFVNPTHYHNWLKTHKRPINQNILNNLKQLAEIRKIIHSGDFIQKNHQQKETQP